MNADTYARLLALRQKQVLGDLVFHRPDTRRTWWAEASLSCDFGDRVEIYQVRMSISPYVDHLSISVHIPGDKRFCALDIVDRPHGDATDCHKHYVETAQCVANRLPYAHPAPQELKKLTPAEAFRWFCEKAKMEHRGRVVWPPDSEEAA